MAKWDGILPVTNLLKLERYGTNGNFKSRVVGRLNLLHHKFKAKYANQKAFPMTLPPLLSAEADPAVNQAQDLSVRVKLQRRIDMQPPQISYAVRALIWKG